MHNLKVNLVCLSDLIDSVDILRAFALGNDSKYLLNLVDKIYYQLKNLMNVNYGLCENSNIITFRKV